MFITIREPHIMSSCSANARHDGTVGGCAHYNKGHHYANFPQMAGCGASMPIAGAVIIVVNK
jgi:hypothetical protein